VVVKSVNSGESTAVALTASKGFPSTLEVNLSLNAPKPTSNSACTSNGFISSAFGSCPASPVDGTPDDDADKMVEEEQNGMKVAYDGTSATIE